MFQFLPTAIDCILHMLYKAAEFALFFSLFESQKGLGPSGPRARRDGFKGEGRQTQSVDSTKYTTAM